MPWSLLTNPTEIAAATEYQQCGSMKAAETSDEAPRVLGQGRCTKQSTGPGKEVLTMSSSVSLATQIVCHVEASAVTCAHGNPDSLPFFSCQSVAHWLLSWRDLQCSGQLIH